MERWYLARDRRRWRAAQNFADLCALTRRYLQGELFLFPGWGASVLDEETLPRRDLLCSCAWGGFLSVASQEGQAPRRDAHGRLHARRSFVAGFASVSALQRIKELDLGELEPLIEGVAQDSEPMELGTCDGAWVLRGGHRAAHQERALFRPHLSKSARAELAQQSFLWLVDPVWEGREHLWQTLANAFERREQPAPHKMSPGP